MGSGDHERSLHFSIKDTGIGIPEAFQSRIFSSYSQSSPDISRKFGGTGLGLAITKRLIELQGGKIGFTSKENHGTEFFFEIPFKDGKVPAHAASVGGKRNCLFNQQRILLAEDNKINQFVAGSILKTWNLHFDIANNGKEALEYLCEKEYDLVLMDLHMPVMDGIEATSHIRKRSAPVCNPDIPIIALTANAFTEIKDEVEISGMNGFITKPIVQDNLFNELCKWLSHEQ